jgi:hypothetical protein
MDVNPWRTRLTVPERRALEEIERVLLKPVPDRHALLAWGDGKLAALVERVPVSVKNQLTQTVSGALERMQSGSARLVSREAVLAKIRRRTGASDLRSLPILALDPIAQDFIRIAISGLTVEGALAGSSGIVGLAADIPILYSILFKTIQEVALCYGFEVAPAQERFHVLQVLDLGHNLASRTRPQQVGRIFHMQGMIRAGTTLEELEAMAISRAGTQAQALTRNLRLARQLAMDLLERKLLQSLVLVGTAVGAASNYQLARDVGSAAYQLYRRRFLMEVALRRRTP